MPMNEQLAILNEPFITFAVTLITVYLLLFRKKGKVFFGLVSVRSWIDRPFSFLIPTSILIILGVLLGLI